MTLPGYDEWLLRDLPDDEPEHYCSRHHRGYDGDECPACDREINDYQWDRASRA